MTSAEWDDRDLPRPTTRFAFAAIESIDDFAPHWSQWADRLGITDRTTISVLGDGAEWIWNAATREFGDCHQLLDIYHAAEHIADAGKGLFGDKTPAAAAWLARRTAQFVQMVCTVVRSASVRSVRAPRLINW